MQFNVPKYIDVEDKIFGPLTFKQFVYIVGGAGLCAIIWWLVPTIFAVPLVAVAAIFSLALAFYEVNQKPFIYIVRSAMQYASNSRLYVWKQRDHTDQSAAELEKMTSQIRSMGSLENKKREKGIQKKSWSIQVADDEKNT